MRLGPGSANQPNRTYVNLNFNRKLKADAIFRNAGLRRLAGGDIVQFGHLHRAFERAILGEAVHQLGQAPAETLRLPHAGQRLGGIADHRIIIGAAEEADERLGGIMQ
ncbi:hypothetical protein E4T56_gene15851, partial [Termitomyces sp. T112]